MYEGDELFHAEINHVDKKNSQNDEEKLFQSIKSGGITNDKEKYLNQLNPAALQTTKKKIFESIKSEGITNDEGKNIQIKLNPGHYNPCQNSYQDTYKILQELIRSYCYKILVRSCIRSQ